MLLIGVEHAQTASYMFWETIRKKSIPCIPLLFAFFCLEEAAAVSGPPQAAQDRRHFVFILLSPTVVALLIHAFPSVC